MKVLVPQNSIEIRPISFTAVNQLACDWGIFENSEADPHRECGIQSLILVTPDYVRELLDKGVQTSPYCQNALTTAFIRDRRTFVRLYHQHDSWTWELFEAHWWDGVDSPIMVGRWLA